MMNGGKESSSCEDLNPSFRRLERRINQRRPYSVFLEASESRLARCIDSPVNFVRCRVANRARPIQTSRGGSMPRFSYRLVNFLSSLALVGVLAFQLSPATAKDLPKAKPEQVGMSSQRLQALPDGMKQLVDAGQLS